MQFKEISLYLKLFNAWPLPPASAAKVIESVPSTCLSVWVCETYIVHYLNGTLRGELSIMATGLLGKRTEDYSTLQVRQCWSVFILNKIRRDWKAVLLKIQIKHFLRMV